MPPLLWVCLGGALGSGARYSVARWALAALGPSFPFGTLFVNVTGSLLIGVVMTLAEVGAPISPTARLALTSGVLGGFTTLSSFSYESLHLIEEGTLGFAVLNVVGTLTLSLLACAAGVVLVRQLAA
jgi:CrcB protein